MLHYATHHGLDPTARLPVHLAARRQCTGREWASGGERGCVRGAYRYQFLTKSGSDEGRLHSHRYQYRCRVVRPQTGAPPKLILSRRSSLIATMAIGASLPLLFGAVQSYGVGADAAYPVLRATAMDFSKIEDGEDRPGGGATSKASVNTANAFSASSGN